MISINHLFCCCNCVKKKDGVWHGKENQKKRESEMKRERERIGESEKKGKLDVRRKKDDATGALQDDSSIS